MHEQESKVKKDILIVDDEYPIIRALSYLFEGMGLLCDTALTGLEALKLLDRTSYRVALVDNTMPGMTGRQLCLKIRENPEHESLHIILMSALHLHAGSEKSPKTGIDEYLVKPFDPKQIVYKLKKIISRDGAGFGEEQA
ncbi:response regulator [Thermodesulfobacteriota bacterium]